MDHVSPVVAGHLSDLFEVDGLISDQESEHSDRLVCIVSVEDLLVATRRPIGDEHYHFRATLIAAAIALRYLQGERSIGLTLHIQRNDEMKDISQVEGEGSRSGVECCGDER